MALHKSFALPFSPVPGIRGRKMDCSSRAVTLTSLPCVSPNSGGKKKVLLSAVCSGIIAGVPLTNTLAHWVVCVN